jgi:hypothetical protein
MPPISLLGSPGRRTTGGRAPDFCSALLPQGYRPSALQERLNVGGNEGVFRNMLKRREVLKIAPRARPTADGYWLHVSRAAMACRTTFSSIQSNAFEDAYEMFMGTKGILILKHEVEAYLFSEGEGATTRVEVSRRSSNPIVDASATRPACLTANKSAEQQARLVSPLND